MITNPEALETWEDITPLARNEWICWVESAKKLATRNKRVNRRLRKPE
ncbi:YdeI/OmpD-associated family protein [Nitrosomonas nitrosa]|nr:YdeI/OmpD-associated family protein [Nitrosomonas nitrosa]